MYFGLYLVLGPTTRIHLNNVKNPIILNKIHLKSCTYSYVDWNNTCFALFSVVILFSNGLKMSSLFL